MSWTPDFVWPRENRVCVQLQKVVQMTAAPATTRAAVPARAGIAARATSVSARGTSSPPARIGGGVWETPRRQPNSALAAPDTAGADRPQSSLSPTPRGFGPGVFSPLSGGQPLHPPRAPLHPPRQAHAAGGAGLPSASLDPSGHPARPWGRTPRNGFGDGTDPQTAAAPRTGANRTQGAAA
jgi:hypothetical protein